MQNDDTDFQAQERHQAKSCLFIFLTAILVLFSLAVAAVASVIILDSIMLRGEEHTLSWRVKRYKAAAQFIWYDFKEAVSKKNSNSSPEDEP